MEQIKHLGEGFQTSGYRVFHEQKIKGKTILFLCTWVQRRCVVCQRFLGKRQMKYCSRCKPIEDRKVNNEIRRVK